MAAVEALLREADGDRRVLNHETAPGWVASPEFRGTPDILWACLVTLAACVYTALHLNIPPSHRTHWQRTWIKIRWVIFALLGPEYVLLTAIQQYQQARNLCRTLNRIKAEQPDSTANYEMTATGRRVNKVSDRVYLAERILSNQILKSGFQTLLPDQYDLLYAYFVVMGGFVVDVRDIHDDHKFVAINSAGVELLARQGHFLEMPVEKIADRSKANFLTKLLVCFQVTWMLTQCIARKTAGYPLTLLELHTMVHVVCALCIYACWWKVKLVSTEVPTTL